MDTSFQQVTVGAALLSVLALSGCMNLTTRFQADDLSVAGTHAGEDCTAVLFGIGIGTSTVEAAVASATLGPPRSAAKGAPVDPIQRIRRLQFTDYEFLGFGARCIEVTGEAGGPPKAAAK